MSLSISSLRPTDIAAVPAAAAKANGPTPPEDPRLRKAFDQFVGETLFGQMLQSMRKTVGKPAYFHGGRAEEVFTQQLDQVLAQKLSESSADQLSGPMYELMTAPRR
jgi:Rod binding domain-containing protein